jgi:hypothetical protein
MNSAADRPQDAAPAPDYRSLPKEVRLDQTIATVDAKPVPDPAAGRNLEHHAALRDD